METRLATPADAPALAILHAASFGIACWSLSQIEQSLALATTQGWILEFNNKELGGEAQGFILCQIVGDEAEILTFCTAPALRRNGIGRLLLAVAMQAAQARAARRMFLEVAADNVAALALYKKTGFQIIGKREKYYRDNIAALLLSAEL